MYFILYTVNINYSDKVNHLNYNVLLYEVTFNKKYENYEINTCNTFITNQLPILVDINSIQKFLNKKTSTSLKLIAYLLLNN